MVFQSAKNVIKRGTLVQPIGITPLINSTEISDSTEAPPVLIICIIYWKYWLNYSIHF